MTEIHIEPNTPEWKIKRFKSLGAADSAAAAGLSRYETPDDFLKYKRAKGAIEKEQTEGMRLGHEYEDKVAQCLSRAVGWKLDMGKMYHKPNTKWITCTLDRTWTRELDGEVFIIEIKFKENENLPDYICIEHICQLHHQMYVMNKRRARIVYGRRELDEIRVFDLTFHDKFFQVELISKYAIFHRHMSWEEFVPLPYRSRALEWTEKKIRDTFQFTQLTFFFNTSLVKECNEVRTVETHSLFVESGDKSDS